MLQLEKKKSMYDILILEVSLFRSLFWGVLCWKRKAEEALLASGLPYTVSACNIRHAMLCH